MEAEGPDARLQPPQGDYNGSKADHVLVDWYLVNAELGDGKFSIKARVTGPDIDADGRTLKITQWKPYALDNLRNGDYKISLELDDKDGKAVPGAWNSTTRTITINRDAADDPPPTPPPRRPTQEEGREEGRQGRQAEEKRRRPRRPRSPRGREAQGREGREREKPKADKPKEKKPKSEEKKYVLAFLGNAFSYQTPARLTRAGVFPFVLSTVRERDVARSVTGRPSGLPNRPRAGSAS